MSESKLTSELYSILKQKSISTIKAINEKNSQTRKNSVFEHNLNVLIELCNQKLDINNESNNDDKLIDQKCNQINSKLVITKYEKSEKFISKVQVNNRTRFQCVFNANECNKQYKEFKRCAEHVHTHTGEKPYKCHHKKCAFKSAYYRSLAAHCKAVHSVSKRFNNTGLKVHRKFNFKRILNPEKTALICDWNGCGFKSCYKGNLIRHKRLHTGEKYVKSSSDVNKCMNKQENQFECDWIGCTYKSKHKYPMIEHKRAHCGEKPTKN